MQTTITPFELGKTVITPNAQDTLHPADLMISLHRHVSGDWGDCDPEDAGQNNIAVDSGLRIFSVYHDREQVRFWIITEADRSATTILLPEDY